MSIGNITWEILPSFTTKNGGFQSPEDFSFCVNLPDVGYVSDAMRGDLRSIAIHGNIEKLDYDNQLHHLTPP